MAQTVTLSNNTEPTHLFYYWTGSRNSQYKGLKKYGLGKDFKPASGRITLTSPIGRGVIHNIECSDNGSLMVEGNVPPCKIGFYMVQVGDTEYVSFIGKAEIGKPLAENECRNIMSLPVLEFEEGDHKSASWLKSSTGGANFHELDGLIPTEAFIQKQLENCTSAQNEEISQMRESNNRKKADLERNLNTVRAELKAVQSKTGKDSSRHEDIRAQREITLLLKKVKDTEKSLHHDKMKLEQELRADVETFLGKSKLTAKIYRQFILNVNGG